MPEEKAAASSVAEEVAVWTGATDKLRDVVKWVAASFGALGAILIGTAPLSNIAKAEFGGLFTVAVVFGVIALGCVGWIFWQSTSLLVPRPLELSNLQEDVVYTDLRQRVNARPVDYLGSNGSSFEEYIALRAQDRRHLNAVDERYVLEQDIQRREKLLTARGGLIARLESSGQVRSRLLAWAEFEQLHTRFQRARVRMFVAAVVAAVGITVFHVAASAAVS